MLFLLLLGYCTVDAQLCTVDEDGLLGTDSGIAVPMAFQYDLTVASGTDQGIVVSGIIPALEIAFAEVLAIDLITGCDGADSALSSDRIVGFETAPLDFIMTGKSCSEPPQEPGMTCFRVQAEMFVYVSDSEDGLIMIFGLSLMNEVKIGSFSAENVHPALESIKVDSLSFSIPTEPPSDPKSRPPFNFGSETAPPVAAPSLDSPVADTVAPVATDNGSVDDPAPVVDFTSDTVAPVAVDNGPNGDPSPVFAPVAVDKGSNGDTTLPVTEPAPSETAAPSESKSGNVIVPLCIVLVFVLLGVCGYMYYRRRFKKKPKSGGKKGDDSDDDSYMDEEDEDDDEDEDD